jgi:AhpD family alkylhydroperoxidase
LPEKLPFPRRFCLVQSARHRHTDGEGKKHMPRLKLADPRLVPPEARDLLGEARAGTEDVSNMLRTMASSPTVMRAYLVWSGSAGEYALSDRLRHQIGLAVSEANCSRYCLSRHAAHAGLAGLTAADIDAARRADMADLRDTAALRFARCVAVYRGDVTDAEVEEVRRAGWTDAQIVEIIALVSMIVFTNYLTSVAQTEIDFPVVDFRGCDRA